MSLPTPRLIGSLIALRLAVSGRDRCHGVRWYVGYPVRWRVICFSISLLSCMGTNAGDILPGRDKGVSSAGKFRLHEAGWGISMDQMAGYVVQLTEERARGVAVGQAYRHLEPPYVARVPGDHLGDHLRLVAQTGMDGERKGPNQHGCETGMKQLSCSMPIRRCAHNLRRLRRTFESVGSKKDALGRCTSFKGHARMKHGGKSWCEKGASRWKLLVLRDKV